MLPGSHVINELERQYHPVANLFPLMQGDEFEALKADILTNGLLEPIWLDLDGRIIDGRNRHRACIETGATMRFRTYNGKSPVAFVVSLNLNRRHLTPSQRAALATDVLPMLEVEARERHERTQLSGRTADNKPIFGPGNNSGTENAKGDARDQAAALFQTNGRYVSDAKQLRETAPDLFEAVRDGQTSLPIAMRKLGARKAEERAKQRAEEPPTPSALPVRLIVGDAKCIDLPDASVDIIITSPPYNLGDSDWPMGGHGRERRAHGIGYNDAMSDEQYMDEQLSVLDELYRVAKPGASLFYNHKTRTRGGVLIHPMAWISRARGWTLRQEIVWDREVTHNHSATLFWPVDERIYWLTKGKPVIDSETIGMPTVWRFHGPAPHTWHPAPFAEELPRRCLQAIGGRAKTVLDPYAGSCTTLKVALDMGHEAVGVDISETYLLRAKEQHGW